MKLKIKSKTGRSGTKAAETKVSVRPTPEEQKKQPLFKPRIQMGLRIGTKGNGQRRSGGSN